MHVVFVSYEVTEESGGPAVAVAGYAAALARAGVGVTLVASDGRPGTWLVHRASAEENGYSLVRTSNSSAPARAREMLDATLRAARRRGPVVLWVNSIWGIQSPVAYAAATITKRPYIVCPNGSLGLAALAQKRWKKLAYYHAVESRILRRAARIHCMADVERNELPASLRSKAFVVPFGIDVPTEEPQPQAGRPLVGILARIHPIKNQLAAIESVERVVTDGLDLELEIAGGTSDPAYERILRDRVGASDVLRDRVRFLGHVPARDVPRLVRRWRAGMLLSDQENFGHAVVTVAAAGVPQVLSPGVALAGDLERQGGAAISTPENAALALRAVLEGDSRRMASAARSFASQYSWSRCAAALLGEIESVARGSTTPARSTFDQAVS